MAANTSKSLNVAVMRSQLGRARGLGAAKSGVHHWWMQRVTALALLPLSLWFIGHVIALAGLPHESMLAWFYSPWTTVFMLCLIVATFYHAYLGLQVVIEDYVHTRSVLFASLLGIRAVCFVLALAGVVATLKLGL